MNTSEIKCVNLNVARPNNVVKQKRISKCVKEIKGDIIRLMEMHREFFIYCFNFVSLNICTEYYLLSATLGTFLMVKSAGYKYKYTMQLP